jgi:two-component system OmpR family sensor kinase
VSGWRPRFTARSLRPADDLRGASVRLTAQFTALMLVVLLIVGGIVFTIVNASVANSNQRTLAAAAQLDSPQDAPDGTYLSIIDGRNGDQVISSRDLPDGLLDTQALATAASSGGEVRSERTVGGHDYLLLTTSATSDRNGDRVVQVALDLRESVAELERLLWALVVAGLVALVLTGAAAFFMARRAMRPLADALAQQRRFIADASHELRTPLTLLTTRAQLLRRRNQTDLPADVTASVDELVTDSHALTGILDDLLIAADPRSVSDPVPVDLVAVASEAVALLSDDASARGIALVRSGDASSVFIDGSRPAMLRLVIALGTNALDHARTAVTVSVSVAGNSALIRVSDDGPGFAPEAAPNAFRRFASGRPTGAGEGKRHYGLGLAIVDEITRRHGGTVRIDTTATSGASVIATIPLRHGAVPPAPTPFGPGWPRPR